MTTHACTVTIHMASGLGGFSALTGGDWSWLETADSDENGVAEENGEEFLEIIDCDVVGSRTSEPARQLGWPYGSTAAIVLTHQHLPAERSSVAFSSGDRGSLVNDQLGPPDGNVRLAAGAALTRDIIRSRLADEIRLSIVPIILGGDTPSFDDSGQEVELLHLDGAKAYRSGFVEVRYGIRRRP